MRVCFCCLALVAIALPSTASGTRAIRPQVDQAEVMRLGDMVQHVGDHVAGDESADAFVAAMSPPESDADKWFISVLSMRGCAGCEKLKRDWATNEWLLALANPNDPKKSWAHYKVYDKDDREPDVPLGEHQGHSVSHDHRAAAAKRTLRRSGHGRVSGSVSRRSRKAWLARSAVPSVGTSLELQTTPSESRAHRASRSAVATDAER